MKRKKLPSLSSLENKLDRLFSEWVRRSSADEGGTVECVTCQKLMFWQGGDAQAGHFVKRQHRATRWDERNVNVQCVRCNQWLGGNEGEHGAYIIKRYGLGVHDELLRLKREVKKFSRAEMQEMIDHYKNKLETLNEPRTDDSPGGNKRDAQTQGGRQENKGAVPSPEEDRADSQEDAPASTLTA